MSHPQFDVDKAFDSQPMNADQLADSAEVRAAAKILAHMILAHVPGSSQRSVALRKLQDVTVWSNKALAENPPRDELSSDTGA